MVVAARGGEADSERLWATLTALTQMPDAQVQSAVLTDATLAIGVLARTVDRSTHTEATVRRLLQISYPAWWTQTRRETTLTHTALFRAKVVLAAIAQTGSDFAERTLMRIKQDPERLKKYGRTADVFLEELIAANRARLEWSLGPGAKVGSSAPR